MWAIGAKVGELSEIAFGRLDVGRVGFELGVEGAEADSAPVRGNARVPSSSVLVGTFQTSGHSAAREVARIVGQVFAMPGFSQIEDSIVVFDPVDVVDVVRGPLPVNPEPYQPMGQEHLTVYADSQIAIWTQLPRRSPATSRDIASEEFPTSGNIVVEVAQPLLREAAQSSWSRHVISASLSADGSGEKLSAETLSVRGSAYLATYDYSGECVS